MLGVVGIGMMATTVEGRNPTITGRIINFAHVGKRHIQSFQSTLLDGHLT